MGRGVPHGRRNGTHHSGARRICDMSTWGAEFSAVRSRARFSVPVDPQHLRPTGYEEDQHNGLPSSNRWNGRKDEPDAAGNDIQARQILRSRVGQVFRISPLRVSREAPSSTNESPFFLLYGRDARLPTETALRGASSIAVLDADDYEVDAMFATAWDVAQNSIGEAQERYKREY